MIEQIMKIAREADTKYWFRPTKGTDILSCVKTDLAAHKDKEFPRTIINDFEMRGGKLIWIREVRIEIPRGDWFEIRGERRTKWHGEIPFTPQELAHALAVELPSE